VFGSACFSNLLPQPCPYEEGYWAIYLQLKHQYLMSSSMKSPAAEGAGLLRCAGTDSYMAPIEATEHTNTTAAAGKDLHQL
jgi:hypothetical protein